MTIPALNLPLSALDEDGFDVEVTVLSRKHGCHTVYRLSKEEIKNDCVNQIIRDMGYRLIDYIEEKENAISKREESENAQRLQ